MQKAITNKSGKPTTEADIDRRDTARQKPSANPLIVASPSPYQSAAQARAVAQKLDSDYEKNRRAQDKAEQSSVSDNPQDAKDFDVQGEG